MNRKVKGQEKKEESENEDVKPHLSVFQFQLAALSFITPPSDRLSHL